MQLRTNRLPRRSRTPNLHKRTGIRLKRCTLFERPVYTHTTTLDEESSTLSTEPRMSGKQLVEAIGTGNDETGAHELS